MASEQYTDILEIDPNQYGKSAAANTAFSAIDSMIGGILAVAANTNPSPYTIPYQSGIDEPLGTKTALRFFKLNVTGAITADWTAYMPSGKQKFFLAVNNTTGGHNVIVKVSGQTGVTIPEGVEAFCFLNGTDVELISLSLMRAASQSTDASPVATTSTVGVMLGLAGAITPTSPGRVKITVCGDVANNTAGDGVSVQIRTGTGSAPANGAALTGTTQGLAASAISDNANSKRPFSICALLTGAVVGTALWIDLGFAALTGGTATVENVTVVAEEL